MAGLFDNLRDVAQGASNSVAGNLTAPVDGINWLLRKAGVPVSDMPVGGSDWLRQKGLTAEPKSYGYGLLGEALGGVTPMLAAAKAPQIAAGMVKAGQNMAVPNAMNSQAGAILHPFLKPSVAFSMHPFQGLSGADASAMTRYRGLLNNPEFANRELLRETGTSQFTKSSTGTPSIITPETMYQRGNPLVAVAGDTSQGGVTYTGINGVPMDRSVSVQSGFQYPIIHDELKTGNAWASMPGPAQGKQTHFDKVTIDTGLQPRGVFFAMNPKDSIDFSSPVSEMMLGQMKALNPSSSAKNSFNKDVQTKFPQFLGLDHPEVRDQLLGVNGFAQAGAGAMRKEVAAIGKKKMYENQGFPSYDDISDAVNHPLLRNSKVGDSGLSTFLAEPGADLGKNSFHNSYSHGILGKSDGGLQVSIPGQNMFPSIWDDTAGMTNKAGAPMNFDQRMGVIKMSHGFQIPDQKWLDQIMPVYEQRMKQAAQEGLLFGPTP